MKKSSVNLENLLEQLSEEKTNLAIESNVLRAAWGDDDDKHDHDRDDDDDEDECECEEKREGNNGLHLGICKGH